MTKLVFYFLIGIVLAVVGLSNVQGDLRSIHWYHRRRVRPEDVPKYGLLMGIGTIVAGAGLILSAALQLFLRWAALDWLVLIGLTVGIALMLYAQIRYNRGLL